MPLAALRSGNAASGDSCLEADMTPEEQIEEGPLSDETVVGLAEELFLELDAREAADVQ